MTDRIINGPDLHTDALDVSLAKQIADGVPGKLAKHYDKLDADGLVTAAGIAPGAVVADIPDGGVATAKLADDAVTADKLAADAVVDASLAASSKVRKLVDTLTSAGQPTDASVDPGSKLARITSTDPRYYMIVADSILENGSNPYYEGPGCRGEFQRLAFRDGVDVRALGTMTHAFLPVSQYQTAARYGVGSPRGEAIGGSTILHHDLGGIYDISTAITSEYTRTGHKPDCVFVLLGANDVGGGASAATMYARLITFVQHLRALISPNAPIVVCSYTYPYTFNAGFAANVIAPLQATDSQVYFEDLSTLNLNLGADYGRVAGAPDVHPNNRGQHAIGARLYARFRSLFPVSYGAPIPRPYASMVPQAVLAQTSIDHNMHVVNAAFNTNTVSRFMAALRFCPTNVSATTLSLIMTWKHGGTVGGWSLWRKSDAAGTTLYLGADGAFEPERMTALGAITLNTWNAGVVHYDEVSGVLSLWGCPAGKPVLLGMYTVVTPIALTTGATLYVGGDGTAATAGIGQFQDVQLCVGTSIPRFDEGMTNVLGAWWFEHQTLPGAVGVYPLDEGSGTVATDLTTNQNGTTTNTWAAIGATHSPPWE